MSGGGCCCERLDFLVGGCGDGDDCDAWSFVLLSSALDVSAGWIPAAASPSAGAERRLDAVSMLLVGSVEQEELQVVCLPNPDFYQWSPPVPGKLR